MSTPTEEMTFSVSKMAPEIVLPSEPTPSSGHLPLSIVDAKYVRMPYSEVILVFRSREGILEPAKVIREGLAKALVPYYPVAGRLVVDPDNANSFQVAPTGEGVPFVVASANCTLQDVEYVHKHPLMIPKEQLIISHEVRTSHDHHHAGDGIPPKVKPVPFMMQVTQFNCGGFTVGIKFNHAMFDGMGAGQFMTAVGEMARGLGEPTIKPVWCRECIPGRVDSLSPTSLPPPPAGDPNKLERCIIDLSLDYIDRLRNVGERCTSFEIVVAKLWQCHTRAIDLQPDDTVLLGFPVSYRRQLINDVLPPEGIGYYGNCTSIAKIESQSEQIASGSLLDIAKLIRQGKERVLTNYKMMLEEGEQRPRELPIYQVLIVVDWRRLGFSDTDYGWGTPDYVVRLTEQPLTFGLAYLVNSPPPMKKGMRVIMQSVAKEHFETFRNGMNDCS